MFAVGCVVISLDAELGWGFHDLESPPSTRVESGRRGWSTLLSLFESFDVSATWAVVGHLFLDRCDGAHADHPSPPEWFHRERTVWNDRPDLRFGPDLIQAICDSPVDHEIGCHGFSHALFGEPATTRSIARAECDRSLELADDWGLSMETFVFPRNSVGHRDVLAETGFRTYRGPTPIPDGSRAVLGSLVSGRSLLVEPTVDEYGLVNVPASTFAFGFEGRARSVAETVWADPMVVQARRGIDEAVDGDGVFHLWFHPNNLVTDRDDERIRAILSHLATRRDETGLSVETMGSIGRRVSAESCVEPTSRPMGDD